MADKDPPINMSTDRARRINSLHRSVDDLVQEQNKKRLQVSTEISALTKEQQKMMATLEAERGEFTNETASAYNDVVKNLGKTIQQLSIGVKNITMDTAKATSSAIGQYGKAIGEDISLNKQNTMAMALARATPLFGYFAAKFMETDVFQNSAAKIKESVSGTLSSAGESLANVFKKKKGEEDGPVPKLQEGGYVRKGGLVEVHSAEVVSPVEKILEVMDAQSNEKVIEHLSAIQHELIISRNSNAENQGDFLKSLNELKVSMIGTVSQMEIAWQRTLLEHPSFKNLLMLTQTMQSVMTAPFKAIFGIRGGFVGDVRRATRTSNVFKQQVNLLAMIYTKGMTFLRNIEKYTKVSAEALVGEEVSPTSDKTYTLFGKIREFMTTRKIKNQAGSALFDDFVTKLKLDRGALAEAGIKSFSDLLSPMAIIRNMGITKENIRGKFKEAPGAGRFEDAATRASNAKFDTEFKARAASIKFNYQKKKAQKQRDEFYKTVKEKVTGLFGMKKDQEKREGPHSPSMAQNIAATSKITEKKYKEDKKGDKEKLGIWQKMKGYAKENSFSMAGLKERFKKMGKGIKEWLPIIFGWLSKVGGYIFKIVKPILDIGKFVAMYFATKTGQMAGKAGQLVGKAGHATATAYRAAGVRGVAHLAGRTAMIGGGAVAGAATGGILGMGMGIWDVIQAIRNPDEWAAGVFTRAMAAFIAGTGSGVKGAAWGATKGAGLGAMVGLIGGPPGVLIGGALGSIVGGALGFVGGKRITKAIQDSMKGIGDFASGLWKIVRFPFDIISEVTKSIWYLLKHYGKKLWKMTDEWLSGPGIIGDVWAGVKDIFSSIFDAFGTLGSIVSNYVKGAFTKEGIEKIKQGITDFFFFIPNIILGIKEIGSMIDEWLLNQPYGIGKAYRWAKKYAKKISAGTLSRDLKAHLEQTSPMENAEIKLDQTGLLAKQYANEELSRNASREAAARKAAEATRKAIEQQTANRNRAQISSTNTIVSSNSTNQVNNNSSGWGSAWNAFSTGQRTADLVALGAMQ